MNVSGLDRRSEEAASLEDDWRDIRQLGEKLLEPREVQPAAMDPERMTAAIAYQGFPERVPHWHWAANYEEAQAQQDLGARFYELINNDTPATAFLDVSNSQLEQKAVLSHVMGHADFFENNTEFEATQDMDVSGTLSDHARTVEQYADREDVDRELLDSAVELGLLNLELAVDAMDDYEPVSEDAVTGEEGDSDPEAKLEDLGFGNEEVRETLADEIGSLEDGSGVDVEETNDIIGFLIRNGEYYDGESDGAAEMEPWMVDTLEGMREEQYIMAPQHKTKVMNEGWATYWQSLMMEHVADDLDESMEHAEMVSKVTNGSFGDNPYRLGLKLWNYVENKENRREVAEKLLRTDGVSASNMGDIDFDSVSDMLGSDVLEDMNTEFMAGVNWASAYVPSDTDADKEDVRLAVAEVEADRVMEDERFDREGLVEVLSGQEAPSDWRHLTYEGLADLHYSLTRPENAGLLRDLPENKDLLSDIQDRIRASRNATGNDYASIEDAMEDVDRTAGWSEMNWKRESQNDINFIEEFVDKEFVREHELNLQAVLREPRPRFNEPGIGVVASTDPDDIKEYLLEDRSNYGKPDIVAVDDNYENRGEALLRHRFHGRQVDMELAARNLERIAQFYGRPVHLETVEKEVGREYLDRFYDELDPANSSIQDIDDEIPDPDLTPVRMTYYPEEGETYREELDEEALDRLVVERGTAPTEMLDL